MTDPRSIYRFRMLGPPEARTVDGKPVALRGVGQRRMLAMLLVDPNQVVPAERLREALDLSPGSLRTAVSRLRGLIGDDVLLAQAPGYLIETESVDVIGYEALLADARDADTEKAIDLYDQAATLWRGDPFVEVADEPWAQPTAVRLSELRAAAAEERGQQLLTLGRWSDAALAMEAHGDEFPFRERPCEILMRALAADGRQADALRAFQLYRDRLGDEVGLEPSDELRDLESKIAIGWRDRVRPRAPSSDPPIGGGSTGPVTLLFTDIEESTARWEHDPDAMIAALDRHDEIILGSIEANAGRAVKHTGDGITASFEQPANGVLAAVEAQLALGDVFDASRGDLRVRMGLHTGVATRRGHDLLGRSVNRAARIMNLAGAGQILCSSTTASLVEGALPATIGVAEIGEHQLRGFGDVERLHAVRHADITEFIGPGQVVGSVRFDHLVETDSFGSLWHATMVGEQADTEVVVRAFSARTSTQPGFAARFELESRMLAGLDEHGIAPLVAAWQDTTGAYLAQKSIEGTTLSDHLAAGEQLGDDDVIRLLGQLAQSLATAHARRIVHGAFTPDTVIIDCDGNGWLGGFCCGVVTGASAPWSSPEVRSTGEATTRSDIYSFGVLARLLLFGSVSAGQSVEAGHRDPSVMAAIDHALERRTMNRPDGIEHCFAEICAALGVDRPRTVEDSVGRPPPASIGSSSRFGFVGRSEEVAAIDRAFMRALAGRSAHVLIEGEAGIGKTALARHAARHIHAEGALILHGRCFERLPLPYQPFALALTEYLRPLTPEERARVLGEHRVVLNELVTDSGDREIGNTVDDASRFARSVSSWIADRSAHVPIVVLIDDLQWADEGSLTVLQHLIESTRDRRLLVITTMRGRELSTEVKNFADVARRDADSIVLDLAGLDADTMSTFLGAASPESARFTQAHDWILEAIHSETAGNPLFITELVTHLAETGVIASLAQHWSPDERVTDLGIPPTVRGVVERRLEALSDASGALLENAAILRDDIDPLIWQAMSGVDDRHFDEQVEELLAARLIEEQRGSRLRYAFSHGIVQSTIRHGLSRQRRARLHRAAARELERIAPERVDALAVHASAGADIGGGDEALAHNYRAADAALAKHSYSVAVSHLRASRELLERGAAESTTGELIDLLIRLGAAERDSGDNRFRDTLLHAATMAQENRDHQRMTAATLENRRTGYSILHRADQERIDLLRAALAVVPDDVPTTKALLLSRLAVELTHSVALEQRLELADEALHLARDSGDAKALVSVLADRNAALAHPSTLEDRSKTSLEAWELARSLGDDMMAFMGAHWHLITRIQAGDPVGVDTTLRAITDAVTSLHQPNARWRALRLQATDSTITGDFARAEELSIESFRIGQRAGFPDSRAYFGPQLFSIRFHQGRIDEMHATAVDGAVSGVPAYVAGLALLEVEMGDYGKAAQTLESLMTDDLEESLTTYLGPVTIALAMMVAHAVRDVEAATRLAAILEPHGGQCVSDTAYFWGAVSHHLGLAAATAGDLEAADAHFGRALRVHEQMGSPPWTALTQVEWARTLDEAASVDATERARQLRQDATRTARTFELGAVLRRLDAVVTIG